MTFETLAAGIARPGWLRDSVRTRDEAGSSIYRVPKAGGLRELVYDLCADANIVGGSARIAGIDATGIYLNGGGGIFRLRK